MSGLLERVRETLRDVTYPEPWSADGPMLSEDTADAATSPVGGLAQPWRAAVAAAELVLIAVLAAGAWWCWGKAQVPVEVPGVYGTPVASTRLAGNWSSLGVAAATAAALVLVDAVRQVMLAWRVRRVARPRRARTGSATA